MVKTVGKLTRMKILEAGVSVWPNATLSEVARRCGMSHAGIIHHFPNQTLQDRIAEYAVKMGYSRVIVQLIASDHPAVKNISARKRREYFEMCV